MQTAGDPNDQCGLAVAVDDSGNVFVTGRFSGVVDFDPGPGISRLQAIGSSDSDAFLAKYTPDGELEWAISWGGTGADFGEKLVTDSDGNAYVFGSFQGLADFDPGPETTLPSASAASNRRYIAKYNPLGGLVWVRAWEHGIRFSPQDMCMGPEGNILITGGFIQAVDFDPGEGVLERTATGSSDGFVLEMDKDGAVVRVHTWSGAAPGRATTITMAGPGAVYIAGTIEHSPGAIAEAGNPPDNNPEINNVELCFVSRLNDAGDMLWTRVWGGREFRGHVSGLMADPSGVVAIGRAPGPFDFDPGLDIRQTDRSNWEPFATAFDPDGNWLGVVDLEAPGAVGQIHPPEASDGYADPWQQVSGQPVAFAPHTEGSVYVTGTYNPPYEEEPRRRPGIFGRPSTTTTEGLRPVDMFLSAYARDGSLEWTGLWGTDGVLYPNDMICVGDCLYIIGGFGGEVDFDAGPQTETREAASEDGQLDLFVMKLSLESDE